jgi:hypothetical protein
VLVVAWELVEVVGWLLVVDEVECGWMLLLLVDTDEDGCTLEEELEELIELIELDEAVELELVVLTLVVEAEEVVVTTVPLLMGMSIMGRAKAEPARAARTKLMEACIVTG